MSKFMLILCDRPADFANVTPEDLQRIIEEYNAWGRGLAGEAGSVDEAEGRGREALGRERVDGRARWPYAEASEVIGGFYTVEAKNYDDAVSIARGCPHIKYPRRIEVREVDF
jgi:hypothetical protein